MNLLVKFVKFQFNIENKRYRSNTEIENKILFEYTVIQKVEDSI